MTEPAVEDAARGPAASRVTILVPVFAGSRVSDGAAVLRSLARAREADVVVLDLDQPAYTVPGVEEADDAGRDARLAELTKVLAGPGVAVRVERRLGHNLQGTVREAVAELNPALVVFAWAPRRERSLLRDELALRDLLLDLPCDIAVLATRGDAAPVPRRVMLAVTDETGATLAREVATEIAEAADGTIAFVAPSDGDRDGVLERLDEAVAALPDPARGSARLAQGRTDAAAILQAASPGDVDLLVVGTPESGVIHRLALGSFAERVARRATVPVLVVKPRLSPARSAVRRVADAVLSLFPAASEESKVETYRTVRTASRGNVDFNVMIALAAAIAALGELLNSPAVVIGGMLVAPLMSPVIALGLGIVHGDVRLLRLSAVSVLRGSLIAVAVGALIGLVIPGADVTAEIASRTSPSLLDLGVAFAAGAAGAFALSREHLSASLPGVAIAAALVPPLAAIGLGVALRDPSVGGGAGLLFMANLVSIAAAAGLVFLLVGYRPEPQHALRLRVFSRGFTAIALLVIAVSVPLTWLTASSLQSARTEAAAKAAVKAGVAAVPGLRSTGFVLDHTADGTLHVTVELETPAPLSPDQARAVERGMEDSMGQPLDVTLRLIQVTEVNGGETPAPTPSPTAGAGN